MWNTLGEDYGRYKTVTTKEELYREIYRRQDGLFQLVFNSTDPRHDVEVLEWVCTLVMAAGNCTLVVEEADIYASPNSIPDQLWLLLKTGRHYGVSFIAVSQRPALLNRLITSQSQRIVCCKIFEPNDVRYLVSVIGPEAESLKELEPLEYLDWRHGKIERGKISWGIPAGATEHDKKVVDNKNVG